MFDSVFKLYKPLKSILLATSCMFFFFEASSQKLPPILQAEKPLRGIYLSYSEFLSNSPSLQADFTIVKRSRSKQFWWGGSDYDLVINDPNSTLKPRKFWGVSTGDTVFVNVSKFQNGDKGYLKFEKLARFCYVKARPTLAQKNEAANGLMAFGAVGGMMSAIPTDAAYIMNINSGNFYILTKTLLGNMLEGDPELKNAFDRERDNEKMDVMLSYLDQYNQIHVSDIGKEKIAKVILYRRDRKEKRDTVVINTGDSIRYDLGPNDLIELNTAGKTIRMCLSSECKNYPIVFDAVNYFQCTLKEEQAEAQLMPTETKVGEFYVREIGVLQERRQKE